MTIIERAHVRAAVARALQLDPRPEPDHETAVAAVATALCLPVEAVHDCMQDDEETAC